MFSLCVFQLLDSKLVDLQIKGHLGSLKATTRVNFSHSFKDNDMLVSHSKTDNFNLSSLNPKKDTLSIIMRCDSISEANGRLAMMAIIGMYHAWWVVAVNCE